ncbi:MAG TPA: 5'-3' exonuclease H3TH domain-containing protein [Verrucomicrobiae bacterium]|nr:5'-3' exonuclease H3TH domain-containing protein [Verrucomicrobiae bacterium]
MPSVAPIRLLIVDGHAYAYRAFHAIRNLSSPSGIPTNAIFGFIKMLIKMQAQLAPSHQVVVWDGGLAAERMAEHPEYKIHRPPMPPDLESQIDGIIAYLEAAGIPSFCQDGVEADDWIAAVALQHAPVLSVVIASSDKDFMQLVSDRIGILNPNDKTEKVWGPDEVRARTGIEPNQVVDWLALIGDSVDNIPGVPGVGPKTATELLKQFGSLDVLQNRLSEVKSDRLRANLTSSLDVLRRNQRLIRLRQEQPPTSLEDLVPRPAATQRLRELFGQWGFRGLLAQLPAEPGKSVANGSFPQQGVLL